MGARPLFFSPEYELYTELEQCYEPALLIYSGESVLLGNGARARKMTQDKKRSAIEEIKKHRSGFDYDKLVAVVNVTLPFDLTSNEWTRPGTIYNAA